MRIFQLTYRLMVQDSDHTISVGDCTAMLLPLLLPLLETHLRSCCHNFAHYQGWESSNANVPEPGTSLCSCMPSPQQIVQQLLALLSFFMPGLHVCQCHSEVLQGSLHTCRLSSCENHAA